MHWSAESMAHDQNTKLPLDITADDDDDDDGDDNGDGDNDDVIMKMIMLSMMFDGDHINTDCDDHGQCFDFK